jgi:enoyl-CoA hydratase/carnithine racemase
LIVAAENASFGQPEITRGWPPVAGNFLLPRQIPQKIAMEMLLLGERISAQRAYEVGLVNKVVPTEDVMPAATRYAERMGELPPLALQAVKELTLRSLDMPITYAPLAWHLRADSVTRIVDESDDKVEGRRAFAEKRKPEFKGR